MLLDLPVLEHQNFEGVLLETSKFRPFRELYKPRVHRRGQANLYKGPMLLVKKSPKALHGRIGAAVSLTDLALNETYYGYSAHLQGSAADLAKYLCLIISSKIALWHALITSGGFGVEREVEEKFNIQETPLPRFENLSSANREKAASLFAELAEGETPERWKSTDEWVGSLFDLTPDDVQTISDTLAYGLPFGDHKDAARGPTAAESREVFADRLDNELQPWAERFGRKLAVHPVASPALSPWHFVAITAGINEVGKIDAALLQAMQQAADTLSSSEIIYRDEKSDCLFVGRLNQARYWSISQARLVARRLIWEHVDFLSGKLAG